jgi:hypothetical protein
MIDHWFGGGALIKKILFLLSFEEPLLTFLKDPLFLYITVQFGQHYRDLVLRLLLIVDGLGLTALQLLEVVDGLVAEDGDWLGVPH